VVARASRAGLTLCNRAKIKRIENPYIIGVFDESEKFRARLRAIAPRNMSRALRARLKSHGMVPVRARMCLIVQKHWFFYHAVVIPMQCSRSPRARTTSPLTHWLGGQHGEEAKEDGEGSEKGREEDQAPEEEVSARRASVFDFERRR
jgi:hypothetical protein